MERRLVLAAIVDQFGWEVLLSESTKALRAARAAHLVSFDKEHDAAEITVHRPNT